MPGASLPPQGQLGAELRVVVASDKFKGTLTSAEVAAAVAFGVQRIHPGATVVSIPVADGGDGTLAAAVAAGFELVPMTASGPTGEPVHTAYAGRRTSAGPGFADLGSADPGSADPGSADPGSADPGSAEPASAGLGSAGLGSADPASTDPGSADRGRSPQPCEGLSPPVMPSPLVYQGRTLCSNGYPLERGSGGSAARSESGVGGDVAVVELADVSGLVRLPGGQLAPLTATSYGAGELIAAAIDAGCRKVILGIGGSASTDGGAGMVRALGARLSGPASNPAEGRAAFAAATSLDLTALRRRLDGVQIVVACDVDNPLTGPNGAAAVYGPQKGADPRQVEELDAALTRWADLVARETGRDLRDAPGAGAAGGVGFAALALLGAELRPGIELVLEMVGFHEHLAGADLVITGEGALDEQTLHGKAVAGVAAAAASARAPGTTEPPGALASLGIPVVAVCGVNRLEPEQLRAAGVRAAYALTDLEPDVRKCIAEPWPLLERLGEWIAGEHLR